MKRYCMFLIVMILCIGFVGCGSNDLNIAYTGQQNQNAEITVSESTELNSTTEHVDEEKNHSKIKTTEKTKQSTTKQEISSSTQVEDYTDAEVTTAEPKVTKNAKKSEKKISNHSQSQKKEKKHKEKSKKKISNKSSKRDGDSKKADETGERERAQKNQSTDLVATTETVTTEEKKETCTLIIECSTILNHMKKLTKGKESLVPSDGMIYSKESVEIQKDDTVMDILKRETKNNKIQMEYNYTPAYKTDYVQGIANLYEMDCGSLSGWTYSVNGTFPSVGCSNYTVVAGDVIKWSFTCDGGNDVR